MGPIQSLHDVLSWLRRRWRLMALFTTLGVMAGLIMALRTERVYTADAVIQIINPIVAVDGDGAPDITRRVQMIEQRLMSREALLELADRYGLFEGMAVVPSEQVAMMRESFNITSIAAAQQGFDRDGSLSALIVSASDDDPETAAAIANDLADALLRESVSDRQSDAQQALDFFRAEEARLRTAIRELETEIASYRSQNEEFLPEATAQRREERSRLADALLEIQQEVTSRRSELAGLDPDSPRALTRRRVATLNDEIAQLAQQALLINGRIAEVQALLQGAPEVEQVLDSYDRRMEQLQDQLTAAAEQRRAAELGARIEVDQQSERFELLERALVPEYPVGTSRKKVAAMGLMGGVLLGILLAYAMEWMQPVMRTSARMERDLQLRPVISIPMNIPPQERRRRQLIWTVGLGVLVIGMVVLGLAMGLF